MFMQHGQSEIVMNKNKFGELLKIIIHKEFYLQKLQIVMEHGQEAYKCSMEIWAYRMDMLQVK
jgi:hypothetical protein